VTIEFLPLRCGSNQKLLGGEVAESLVKAGGVVDSLPSLKFEIELRDRARAGVIA
jgi:hypothetical protein